MKIKTTGYSSDRFGNCEICGTRCSEVFKLITNNLVFGHRKCLQKLKEEKYDINNDKQMWFDDLEKIKQHII